MVYLIHTPQYTSNGYIKLFFRFSFSNFVIHAILFYTLRVLWLLYYSSTRCVPCIYSVTICIGFDLIITYVIRGAKFLVIGNLSTITLEYSCSLAGFLGLYILRFHSFECTLLLHERKLSRIFVHIAYNHLRFVEQRRYIIQM